MEPEDESTDWSTDGETPQCTELEVTLYYNSVMFSLSVVVVELVCVMT